MLARADRARYCARRAPGAHVSGPDLLRPAGAQLAQATKLIADAHGHNINRGDITQSALSHTLPVRKVEVDVRAADAVAINTSQEVIAVLNASGFAARNHDH
ncbi:hypothetical protein [Bordetella pertussis]|uniref:hypothetical protein n=1 Tax=Bordetella pertussis TaxID=520 RepID=UPI0039B77B16